MGESGRRGKEENTKEKPGEGGSLRDRWLGWRDARLFDAINLDHKHRFTATLGVPRSFSAHQHLSRSPGPLHATHFFNHPPRRLWISWHHADLGYSTCFLGFLRSFLRFVFTGSIGSEGKWCRFLILLTQLASNGSYVVYVYDNTVLWGRCSVRVRC